MSSEKITCPICNESATVVLSKNDYNHFRCCDCGLLFVHPLPKTTEHIYAVDYFNGAHEGFGYVDYDQDKAAMKKVFNQYLKELELLAGGVGKIFDIGAATGYFLSLAQQAGWVVSGMDISEHAASVARAKGIPVVAGLLEDVVTDESFDVVTMWDVIEHVRNPIADLKKVHRMLRKGGVLAINTPNSGSLFAKCMGKHWHLLVPPEHLHYFTVSALSKALDSVGFRVVKVKYPGKSFTLEYITHTLARWQKLFIWKKLSNWLRHHPRFGYISIPINLRDNVLVYAVKD